MDGIRDLWNRPKVSRPDDLVLVKQHLVFSKCLHSYSLEKEYMQKRGYLARKRFPYIHDLLEQNGSTLEFIHGLGPGRPGACHQCRAWEIEGSDERGPDYDGFTDSLFGVTMGVGVMNALKRLRAQILYDLMWQVHSPEVGPGSHNFASWAVRRAQSDSICEVAVELDRQCGFNSYHPRMQAARQSMYIIFDWIYRELFLGVANKLVQRGLRNSAAQYRPMFLDLVQRMIEIHEEQKSMGAEEVLRGFRHVLCTMAESDAQLGQYGLDPAYIDEHFRIHEGDTPWQSVIQADLN
ncbi:hypothetical protein SCAR479_01478 [Seiridium cardinale]|uniref:Uncharacterized protein n=1 Tax=Seiridium cardinale TaxID=138064 RepID=A0ABR2Y5J9_9PEZI